MICILACWSYVLVWWCVVWVAVWLDLVACRQTQYRTTSHSQTLLHRWLSRYASHPDPDNLYSVMNVGDWCTNFSTHELGMLLLVIFIMCVFVQIYHGDMFNSLWPGNAILIINLWIVVIIIQCSCWGVGVEGGGVYWFPSIRPASRVCSVAPTVLVGSISYIYILSSNFRRCDACKGCCKI